MVAVAALGVVAGATAAMPKLFAAGNGPPHAIGHHMYKIFTVS